MFSASHEAVDGVRMVTEYPHFNGIQAAAIPAPERTVTCLGAFFCIPLMGRAKAHITDPMTVEVLLRQKVDSAGHTLVLRSQFARPAVSLSLSPADPQTRHHNDQTISGRGPRLRDAGLY